MALDKQTRGGTLFIVGTPIGNIADLSPRAADVLGNVDVIAAEDTRHTRGLLLRIGVKTPLLACHDHNERDVAPTLVARLISGEKVALVSDAGMPLISDPGWLLVSQAIAAGVEVVSIPGPCAATAALSIAGLASDRYVFEGFLPRRSSARRERLSDLVHEHRTLVFYESVHRVVASLQDMQEIFGAERRAAIARELTKMHEVCYRGTLAELCSSAESEMTLAGEFVVMVAGANDSASADAATIQRTYQIVNRRLPPRDAVALTAELTGAARNSVYRLTRTDVSGEPDDSEDSH